MADGNEAEEARRELELARPGWQIVHDDEGWHCCPQPVLHAGTPGELLELIGQAHAEALLKYPALRMECGTPLPWRS